jgi:hypothetical protein
MVSRLIEDARNGREHVVGRVAFTQNFGLQILRDTQEAPLWRRVPFLILECG